MHGEDIHLAEIERQIAGTAAKLRELIEQAASYSIAMSEELSASELTIRPLGSRFSLLGAATAPPEPELGKTKKAGRRERGEQVPEASPVELYPSTILSITFRSARLETQADQIQICAVRRP